MCAMDLIYNLFKYQSWVENVVPDHRSNSRDNLCRKNDDTWRPACTCQQCSDTGDNQWFDHPKADNRNNDKVDKLFFNIATLGFKGERFINEEAENKRNTGLNIVGGDFVQTKAN